MKKIGLDLSNLYGFVSKEDFAKQKDFAMKCCATLNDGDGAGSEFLGWRNLASAITMEQLKEIKRCAASLVEKCEVVVVIGVGGSYIGSRAAIKALTNNFSLLKPHRRPHLVWVGNNLSGDYASELHDMLSTSNFGIVVISKSGTTLEPAIAFRLFRKQLEERYGRREAATRIVVVTDQSRGLLRQMAQMEGYSSFIIPDDVGGRFSVLSPVGLIPMAIAGIDIEALMEGAYNMEEICCETTDFEEHPAAQYAAARNLMYERGKKIELLATFEPKLSYFGQWWMQLFAESEGKDSKGLFPVSVCYSQDLHSVGQYVQDGERTLFETFVVVEKMDGDMTLRKEKDDTDELNYLAGRTLGEVNQLAYKGVATAHYDGGVPSLTISLPKMDVENIGSLIYFFEYACAVSGYMLGINPFDQDGVESYKRNIFALLDRPGYEKESDKLKQRLNEADLNLDGIIMSE